MNTRTEYYGSSKTPCLVVSYGKSETWVALSKVKAVLAVGAAEAQAWVDRNDKSKSSKAPMSPEVEALVQAEVLRRLEGLKVTPANRIDPIEQPAPTPTPMPAPQAPAPSNGKPTSKLAALVARAAAIA